jgi:ubiquinone/menaquinone biosynthesis C-methylase UbiE
MTEDRISSQAWSDVDSTGAAGQFAQYLDNMTGLSFTQEYKRRTFELLQARPGHRLLDVGCGTGDDVRALAVIVKPFGQVTGVDASAEMIAEARLRSDALGLPVEFRVGDGHALDFRRHIRRRTGRSDFAGK